MIFRRASWLVMGAALITAALSGVACRGDISDKPPIHLNPNMDNVARYDMQEPNPFFEDGRAMRPQVDGTVARGELREDDHFWRGQIAGEWAMELPDEIALTEELVRRGKERFGIYCAPCHDAAGTGKGIVVQRGMLPPMPYDNERLLAMPIGQIFNIMSYGVRLMPAYGPQIPAADRWAVAVYVRALQHARTATVDDLPAGEAAKLQGGTP